MTRILDIVYFGRIDRTAFLTSMVGIAMGFGLLVVWVLATTSGANGFAVIDALWRSASPIEAPGILLAHGVSEHRAMGVLTLIGLFLIAATFLMAARARDIGLLGWPTALVSMALFLILGEAASWAHGLGGLVAIGYLALPSRTG